MHVVTAFHAKWKAITQPFRNDIRPGAKRHDGMFGLDRAGFGAHRPPAHRLAEGGSIAPDEASAEALEQPDISERQRMRIAHRPGIVPFQAADEIMAQMRFGCGKLLGVEFRMGNAMVARQTLGESKIGIPPRGGSVRLHPAVLDDQITGFRLLDQDIVLRNRMLDQRRIGAGNCRVARGCGIVPVAAEKRRDLRQSGEVIAGIDAVVQGIAQQQGEILREGIRHDAFSLD